jgi:enamine deaminase RidA (YjgF/YER057c/UK114 family)
MSLATFSQHKEPIGSACDAAGFSNAVTIPANAKIVITAGQAGLDLKTGKLVETSISDQISAAFDCCDAALKSAGVKDGLAAAHRMASFFIDVRHDTIMMEIWRTRYPNRKPAWTSVGVASLVLSGMMVEIQAEALLE